MTPAISEYRSSGIRELTGDLTEGDERNSEIGGIFPQLFARPRVLEAREEEVDAGMGPTEKRRREAPTADDGEKIGADLVDALDRGAELAGGLN